MKLMEGHKVVGFSLYTADDKPLSVTAGTGVRESAMDMGMPMFHRVRDQTEKEREIERLEMEMPMPLEPRVTVGLGLDRNSVNIPPEEFDDFVAACLRVQDEIATRKQEIKKHKDKLRGARRAQ